MDSNVNNNEILNQSINQFNDLSQEIDSFISYDLEKSQHFIGLTKCLYDLNKRLVNENISQKSVIFLNKKSLNELFTKGFDEEQVWQQIQLQNQPILDLLVKEVADISVKSNRLKLNIREQNENKLIDSQNNQIIDSNEIDVYSECDESMDENTTLEDIKDLNTKKNSETVSKSIVDDMFFKLREMEVFLNNEDLKEENKRNGTQEWMSEESDDDIDYFEGSLEGSDNGSDDETDTRNAMFKDFFDAPNDYSEHIEVSVNSNDRQLEEIDEEIDTRDVEDNDIENNSDNNLNEFGFDVNTSSDSEDEAFGRHNDSTNKTTEESNDNKSEFERIEVLLKEKIAKQERENLNIKLWQMGGEVVADKRPENSLLQEHLQFDHISRPAPLITEDTTVKLEDIIKQRIKDNSFDDIERKVKPKEKPFEYKRRIEMEFEKSKQSLAQIYENEYLKQQKQKEDEENGEHLLIKKQMRNLFVQLDALSNFNFTPRPPQPEIKIINNLPAITVEEVTPLAVSDVSLLAPQEVFNNQKRELQSKTEKTKTDRNRAQRLKRQKKSQRKKFKFTESTGKTKTESKKNESISDTLSKNETTKAFKSSKKFFEKLHEKTTEIIAKKNSKKKNIKSIKQSKELKL